MRRLHTVAHGGALAKPVCGPVVLLRRGASRRPCVAYASGVRARWCIDVHYGHKQSMTSMLQEWVADVGAQAGLTPANSRLSSGSVGVAESRLELEVTFSSLAEWEQFLAAIPAKEHRAWSQRVQAMIVGGSPRWELFRAVPAFPIGQEPAAAAASVARPIPAAPTAPASTADAAAWATDFLQASGVSSAASSSASALLISGDSGSNCVTGAGSKDTTAGGSGLSIVDNQEAAEVVLDWKGEPLKINPGDKLPFKFL